MASVTRDQFLQEVHGDPQLQQALGRSELMACAVRIAQAAGMAVEAADLRASSGPSGRAPSAEAAGPADGDVIDFDGDGVPDAVMRGGRWVMRESEE